MHHIQPDAAPGGVGDLITRGEARQQQEITQGGGIYALVCRQQVAVNSALLNSGEIETAAVVIANDLYEIAIALKAETNLAGFFFVGSQSFRGRFYAVV